MLVMYKQFLKNYKNLLKNGNLVRQLHTTQVKLAEENFEEIKIPVPWGHIAGKWWGDKNVQPVLAIHGWQDNANSFDNIIPLLNLSSVLAIDLPGHGYSSHFPDGKYYDFGDYLITLHRIVKYYNWTNVSLLTHSFGGALGYTYASFFPDKVKWLINFECARAPLTLLRLNLSNVISKGIDTYLKIEKQKKEHSPPAYKLSRMIQMCIEGSLGSVTSPEAAMILLKRAIQPADEKSVAQIEKVSFSTDLEEIINSEKHSIMSMSEQEQAKINDSIKSALESFNKVREDMKNFQLNEADDQYYMFIRDPLIKVPAFDFFDEELLIETSKFVKCPVLSVQAKNGFLKGSTKYLYDKTLGILRSNCRYFEHHEIEGSHHSHLNTPEFLAPIINKFLQQEKVKWEPPMNII